MEEKSLDLEGMIFIAYKQGFLDATKALVEKAGDEVGLRQNLNKTLKQLSAQMEMRQGKN